MTDHWTVDYRPGGWARAQSGTVQLYLHLQPDDANDRRLRIYTAVLSADEPITEDLWRDVPISGIEHHLVSYAWLSSPEIDRALEALKQKMAVDGFTVQALEDYFASTPPLEVHGMIPSAAWGRKASVALRGQTLVDGKPLVDQFDLKRPESGVLTDDFLRNVAGFYMAMVEVKESPAPIIAARTGASVRTVHGWIAEARKRGFLPPASRGKAG